MFEKLGVFRASACSWTCSDAWQADMQSRSASHVYVYAYVRCSADRRMCALLALGAANLRTKILDFRGFDSSEILIVRGGILKSIGTLTESLSQGILEGRILVGRLGVMRQHVACTCCTQRLIHGALAKPELCMHAPTYQAR